MNSVAYQMVATMVSANLSAARNMSVSSNGSGEFSKVFDQVNANAGEASHATSSNNVDLQGAKTNGEVLREQAAEPVSDKIKRAVEEVKGDVTEMEGQPVEEEAIEAVDAAIEAISQMLGISEEALRSILEEGQMTFTDLGDGDTLLSLVQEVFGHDDIGTLLMDAEATSALKEVKETIGQVLESLGMDMEELASMLQQASTEGQKESLDTTPKSETAQVMEVSGAEKAEGPEMEVVDMREGKETTEYKDDLSGGQEQNRQTFGEMISQQLASVKETANVSETVRSEFQQISTSEVIDQIVTKAIVNLSDEKTSMQLQLNPNHLGKVAVSVTAEQGVIKGQFVAENHVVKEMLETNMIQLKAQLEEQGIKVDKIEVTLGNATDYFNQKEQDQQQEASRQNKGRKVGRISRLMQMEEGEVTEAEVQTPIQTSVDVHTVEYSA